MGLNIKNEETHRLAKELAERTGESVTAAVTEAVRERLKRVGRARKGELAKRLVAIGKDCAKHLPREARSLDHGKLLYDDRGLPT
jgi:antitoxin VapB